VTNKSHRPKSIITITCNCEKLIIWPASPYTSNILNNVTVGYEVYLYIEFTSADHAFAPSEAV